MAEHEIIDPALLKLSAALVHAAKMRDRFGEALVRIALSSDERASAIAQEALFWSRVPDEGAAADAAANHGLSSGSY